MGTFDVNKKVKVTNRTDGSLAYQIESLGIVRRWVKPGDYLNISVKELLELKTAPGGMKVLTDCIIIEDTEALKVVLPDVEIEPEYHYGLDEVDSLLYSAETEVLLDALDYAPKGVLDLIRKQAGEKLPNTTDKIEALNEKFGIDLHKINELSEEKFIPEEEVEPVRRRRSTPLVEIKEEEEEKEVETNVTDDLPKYNVVKRD